MIGDKTDLSFSIFFFKLVNQNPFFHFLYTSNRIIYLEQKDHTRSRNVCK